MDPLGVVSGGQRFGMFGVPSLWGHRRSALVVRTGGCHGEPDTHRIPAIRFGIPLYRGLIELDPSHRREWQIVQSQFDLRDLSP